MRPENQPDPNPVSHTRSGTTGEGNRRRSLIIVEDNDSCAATLEIALERLDGIRLICYRRAEEALAHIEQDAEADCCALVTDLHLPGMDGFDLVRLVRKRRPADGFPIVVISGDGELDTPALALQSGANVYFRKPYSPVRVRRTLEQLLNENNNPSDKV